MNEKQGRLGVYSVFDVKAQVFMTPFFTQNDGTAKRSFSQLVNDNKDNMVAKYPEDFHLFRVGSFDDLTGEILKELPSSLGVAASFKV